MFWNLENLFIPTVDSPDDNIFTPRGRNHWTYAKFLNKCENLAKVIMLTKDKYNNYPLIIGLCEIENRKALNSLLNETPLHSLHYRVLHRESKDHRGIDVALLYKSDAAKVVKSDFFPLIDKRGDTLQTRDILYAQMVIYDIDTLHILVNHWPSKLGGDKVSQPKRELASSSLRAICSTILSANPAANIIAMGDFNDNAYAAPLQGVDNMLNMSIIADSLIHRSSGEQRRKLLKRSNYIKGTYKYKGVWEQIDHFFISYPLYRGKILYVADDSMEILTERYLLEEDKIYGGYKVRRTFVGPRYNGGISDHLPVILKVYERK